MSLGLLISEYSTSYKVGHCSFRIKHKYFQITFYTSCQEFLIVNCLLIRSIWITRPYTLHLLSSFSSKLFFRDLDAFFTNWKVAKCSCCVPCRHFCFMTYWFRKTMFILNFIWALEVLSELQISLEGLGFSFWNKGQK